MNRIARETIDEIDDHYASECGEEKCSRHFCEPELISNLFGSGWLNPRDLKQEAADQKNENWGEDQAKKHSSHTDKEQSVFGDSQNDLHFLYISQ